MPGVAAFGLEVVGFGRLSAGDRKVEGQKSRPKRGVHPPIDLELPTVVETSHERAERPFHFG